MPRRDPPRDPEQGTLYKSGLMVCVQDLDRRRPYPSAGNGAAAAAVDRRPGRRRRRMGRRRATHGIEGGGTVYFLSAPVTIG